jgi:predicted NBD/HSP70 family sugar kinase
MPSKDRTMQNRPGSSRLIFKAKRDFCKVKRLLFKKEYGELRFNLAEKGSRLFMRKIDLTNFQIATSQTARGINRGIVLNLIRKHQPISRADLARYSRLQRSTISAITEELIAGRWVMEGAVGHLPRGRKPTFLHLNPERAGIIGVNVRPISTTIALARLDASFISQVSVPTENASDQFIEHLTERLSHLVKSHPGISFEGIGMSLPGRVDAQLQKLVFAPNLGWRNLDLKTPLEKATGLPVVLENAANAYALAEIWFGRHSESVRNLIAVTVSEGIGVGLILNGQLVRGRAGTAGEFGHVSLNENGPLCNCGNRGCWELYASNLAAVDYYERSFSAKRNGKVHRPKISFSDILALSKQGDLKAIEALDRMARYLGAGLAMLVSGISPDVIIVVGEVTSVWDQIVPIIRAEIKRHCPALAIPQILPTDDTTQPRMLGAVALILHKYFSTPQIV